MANAEAGIILPEYRSMPSEAMDERADWVAYIRRVSIGSEEIDADLAFLLVAHNLVLDTLRVLEEESVVASRRIFRILPWRAHYRSPYSLQFRMEPIDFGARCGLECQMMERPWFPAVDLVVGKSA